MSRDLALLSATQLAARYRRGELSPVEATRAALAQIAQHNERFRAFNLVDEEGALRAAARSERRWRDGAPLGPLDGVPASIKDVLVSRGWPTLKGSRTTEREQPWDEDAPAVARLREGGAVFLGKTTTPEFGWKAVTDSPLTGITRNPWDERRTPGGSSGGAAVAAALGMGALHLGTDGGGSIRIPASFTGVFGLKPSFGRVPAYPDHPFSTVAHVGPITRTVADAALLLSAISAPDRRAFYALPPDGADYLEKLSAGVEGRRIAYAPTLGGASVDPEVAALVHAAASRFEMLGATVEEAAPELEGCEEAFRFFWFAAAANALAACTPEQKRVIDPGLVAIAARGGEYTLEDYFAATKAREAIGRALAAFHARYDLLLLPTMPIPAFAAGRDTPGEEQGNSWLEWTPFTYPFNLSRQPAASVPCGLTVAGLPVGLQIVGPSWADRAVLQAAAAFETLRPWAAPEP